MTKNRPGIFCNDRGINEYNIVNENITSEISAVRKGCDHIVFGCAVISSRWREKSVMMDDEFFFN